MSTQVEIVADEITEGIIPASNSKVPETPLERDPNGNLVGSQAAITGFHIPIFDLDFDCRLIPSRTPGRFHLYLHQPISQEHYQRILEAMQVAGLVQSGWMQSLENHGRTYLRLPADQSLLPTWAPKLRFQEPETKS